VQALHQIIGKLPGRNRNWYIS